ncbi:hypothetical protein ACJJTC_007139 [Scirpophaga incertulas]
MLATDHFLEEVRTRRSTGVYLKQYQSTRYTRFSSVWQLFDKGSEMEAGVQTDLLLDRPASPLYVPAKTGADAHTQIYPGDEARVSQAQAQQAAAREARSAAAAAALARGWLADAVPAALRGLQLRGCLAAAEDSAAADLLPWLVDEVAAEIEALLTSRDLVTVSLWPLYSWKQPLGRVRASAAHVAVVYSRRRLIRDAAPRARRGTSAIRDSHRSYTAIVSHDDTADPKATVYQRRKDHICK